MKSFTGFAHAILRDGGGYDALLNQLEKHTFILLGEATHGTEEFYRSRVEITKRLIHEQGIAAIAVEADWPAAHRVNQYVRWLSADRNANEALAGFTRFPLWMWRNDVVLEFVEWLRLHNENLSPEQQVGFYGLDMYSLYESVAAVLEYLDRVDPEAADRARDHYGCLDQMEDETGTAFSFTGLSCEEKVKAELQNLHKRFHRYAKENRYIKESITNREDDFFQAEQNARLIVTAEAYYRHMLDSRKNTWNMRDSHMFDTLCALHRFLSQRQNQPARLVVWEHNSHLGDARATSMGWNGQHNVGQLMREKYREQTYLLGYTTYSGTVTAASRWDGPPEKKKVRDALPGSIEDLLHQAGIPAFFLPTSADARFAEPRLQRAIGVLYLPRTERQSHYMTCRLNQQFDGMIHVDVSSALHPLDSASEWLAGEEQTYPFGI